MQFKKCSGNVIPQYKVKRTTINSLTNPNSNDINKVADDGDLKTYISYEETHWVCYDCKKRECIRSDEKV